MARRRASRRSLVAAAHRARRPRGSGRRFLLAAGRARRRARLDAPPVPRSGTTSTSTARSSTSSSAPAPSCSTLLVAEKRVALARRPRSGSCSGSRILGNTRLDRAAALRSPSTSLWNRAGIARRRVVLVALRRDGRAVGRAQQGAGGLLRADDGRPRALEGEQRQHVLDARPRRLDRRRAAAPGRAAADARVHAADIYKQTGKKIRRRRVRADALYRARDDRRSGAQHPGEKLKLMQQATRMLWDPRPIRDRDGSGCRRQPAPADLGRGLVRDPALPARAARSRSSRRPAASRRSRVVFLVYETLAAMLFAGRDPLPGAVGLRARAARRRRRRPRAARAARSSAAR